jgi:hypothetical protein
MTMRGGVCKFVTSALLTLVFAACSSETAIHHTLREVGAEALRNETLDACRPGFAAERSQRISEDRWPASARAFKPIEIWAEPDGAYILLDSDADGERGIYLPRILADKDPVCGPMLTHVKLVDGVYTYNKKR